MATLQINPSLLHTEDEMKHGVYHLAANPATYEIARSNNFEFVVDFGKDDRILRAGENVNGSTASQYITNVQELLRLSVNGSSIPHFTQRPIQVKRGNNTLNYAGTPEWGTHTLQCIDFLGTEAKEILLAWQNASYDINTEKVGLVSDYKKTCSLIEYSPDYQKIREWTLYGCWISEISESDFNADENGKRQIRVNIVYDKAQINRVDKP